MRRKRVTQIEQANTSFARWRLMLGLTQKEAGDKLGKSYRTIQDYERTDRPARTDLCTRIVMQMIAQGCAIPTPWPQ